MTEQHSILTFYQFADFPEFEDWKPKLADFGEKHGILGTIILASEGINATISGPEKGVERFMKEIRNDPRFSKMPSRECLSKRTTFYRLRINLRKEIVTLGDPSISPAKVVGKYVEPEDWNDLLEDPGETTNIIEQHATLANRMREQLQAWQASCVASAEGADY